MKTISGFEIEYDDDKVVFTKTVPEFKEDAAIAETKVLAKMLSGDARIMFTWFRDTTVTVELALKPPVEKESEEIPHRRPLSRIDPCSYGKHADCSVCDCICHD